LRKSFAKRVVMEKAWHLRVCECHALSKANNKRLAKNHAVQNTNEILSHYLLYEAGDNEAAEKRKAEQFQKPDGRTAAEKRKVEQFQKPDGRTAADQKKLLKAVHKRLYAERVGVYEARSEEATEMRT
jgi:hypothetical protein